ncbi:hypothetical protein JM658_09985 [Joostella atrarenae]|uniref:Uncharacterized protein n=1 Tax=Joostella atrarenae TaxID=679257 RepID=A0ABS9J425_9FLAO|nr:hypothetical protein [Joostella atrarenae]
MSLSFLVCSDEVAVDVTSEKVVMSQDQHPGDLDLDLCSPFCQCQCCHIPMITLEEYDFAVIDLSISTKEDHFYFNIKDDFLNSILQPPRV